MSDLEIEGVKVVTHQLKWWQDWRYMASVAAIMIAGALIMLGLTALNTNSLVGKIEQNQEGIDELVAFVREIQKNAENDTSVDLQIFIDLLCASSDPERVAFCTEHNLYNKG